MFRGRVKLLKYALSESGTCRVSLNASGPSYRHYRLTTIYYPECTANYYEMTYLKGKNASPKQSFTSKRPSYNSLIPNSILGQSSSDGYYRYGIGLGGGTWHNRDRKNKSKCKFNFNSINITLLETFGLIGTAVAVGIDVRTRIQEWMPYQNRRIQDFCQNHHHHNGKSDPIDDSMTICSNDEFQSSRFTKYLHPYNKPLNNGCFHDQSLTTIKYCGSCSICRSLFDKLLRLYVDAFPVEAISACPPSSALRIFPDRKSSTAAHPQVEDTYKAEKPEAQSDKCEDDEYFDDVDGPASPVFEHFKFNQKGHFESLPKTSRTASSEQLRQQHVFEKEQNSSPPPVRAPQRKKSIYSISEEASQQLQQLNEKRSSQVSPKSDYFSESDSSQFLSDAELSSDLSTKSSKDASSPPSIPVRQQQEQKQQKEQVQSKKKVSENDNDILAIFRMASIEYADQLNNLMAISLMNSGRDPDEAMQCWASCETSSRAFFNMGVAFECGKHAHNAQPDLTRAHDCYALAASMGHRDAIYNLALFYLYGKGQIEVDIERAIEMLKVAASKGVRSAQHFITELNRNQMIDEVRQKLQQPTSVENLKRRPLRTSIRPTASLYGPDNQAKLKPKHFVMGTAQARNEAVTNMRRSNSAPNLHELATSPVVAP